MILSHCVHCSKPLVASPNTTYKKYCDEVCRTNHREQMRQDKKQVKQEPTFVIPSPPLSILDRWFLLHSNDLS